MTAPSPFERSIKALSGSADPLSSAMPAVPVRPPESPTRLGATAPRGSSARGPLVAGLSGSMSAPSPSLAAGPETSAGADLGGASLVDEEAPPPLTDPSAFEPLKDDAVKKGEKFLNLHRTLITSPMESVGFLFKNYYLRISAVLLLCAIGFGIYWGVDAWDAWMNSDERAMTADREAALADGSWDRLVTHLEQYPLSRWPDEAGTVHATAESSFAVEAKRTLDDAEIRVGEQHEVAAKARAKTRLDGLTQTWQRVIPDAAPPGAVLDNASRMLATLDRVIAMDLELALDDAKRNAESRLGEASAQSVWTGWTEARDRTLEALTSAELGGTWDGDLRAYASKHDAGLKGAILADARQTDTLAGYQAAVALFPEERENLLPAIARRYLARGELMRAAQLGYAPATWYSEFITGFRGLWEQPRDLAGAKAAFSLLATPQQVSEPEAAAQRARQAALAQAYLAVLADGGATDLARYVQAISLDRNSLTYGLEAFSLGFFRLRLGRVLEAQEAFRVASLAAPVPGLTPPLTPPLAYYEILTRTLTDPTWIAQKRAETPREKQLRDWFGEPTSYEGFTPGERVKLDLLYWTTTLAYGDLFQPALVARLSRALEAPVFAAALSEFNGETYRHGADRLTVDALNFSIGLVRAFYVYERDAGFAQMAMSSDKRHQQTAHYLRQLYEIVYPADPQNLASNKIIGGLRVLLDNVREKSTQSGAQGFFGYTLVRALGRYYQGYHAGDRRGTRPLFEGARSDFATLVAMREAAALKPLAQLYLARLSRELNQEDDATMQLADLVRRHPNYAAAQYWLFDAQVGDRVAGKAHLQAISMLPWVYPRVLYELATLSGDAEAAARYRLWYARADSLAKNEFPPLPAAAPAAAPTKE